MVTRPVVVAVICVGFFLIFQTLIPKANALKNPPNVERFLMGGHRKNYNIVQRARDNGMGSIENTIAYDVEPFDPERNPDDLSAFIMDYANMIRNDVILLDKSVETRTRKRGNLKVKKYDNQVIPDLPCGCKYNVTMKDLGEDAFPRKVETRNCSKGQNSCMQPLVCKENLYNLTILKKRGYGSEPKSDIEDIELHGNLKWNWYAVRLPISVGCTCSLEYITALSDTTVP